jgi:GNAT superfamily N-acetyltransferase
MKIFSHEVIQKQYASVDYRKNMSIIGLVQKGGYKEIIAIGSYAEADMDEAEVALVIREDFQNRGVGSYILAQLETIAKENSYERFIATVLSENATMIHVFRKRYPNAEISNTGSGEVTIRMDFTDARQIL